MDLRQIKYFLAVAEERNITKAAKKLHLSQPPLSRALIDLEKEFNCKLMIRGKRSITLTPEGLALKRRGEQLVTLTDMTKTEILNMEQGLSGTLYIGHVDSDGPTLIAEWISSFKKVYPNVTYNLWCGTVDDLTYRLKSGLIDLAITMSPSSSDTIDGIKVFSEDWVAIIPSNHPLAKNKKSNIHVKELANEDLIISSRKIRENEIRQWFKPTNIEPHFIVKTAHSSNASKLVDKGIGIALFPASVAKNISVDTKIVIKKVTPTMKVDYLLSWNKEKENKALEIKFIEHVKGLY
jgi:DNA-binding transcriptional LysR family regulator